MSARQRLVPSIVRLATHLTLPGPTRRSRRWTGKHSSLCDCSKYQHQFLDWKYRQFWQYTSAYWQYQYRKSTDSSMKVHQKVHRRWSSGGALGSTFSDVVRCCRLPITLRVLFLSGRVVFLVLEPCHLCNVLAALFLSYTLLLPCAAGFEFWGMDGFRKRFLFTFGWGGRITSACLL